MIAAISAAVIILTLFVSFAPKLNIGTKIPTWPDLFTSAGLRDNSAINKLPLSVHFINVGQGDCILIKTDKGNALIDAGDTENSETITRYLHNHNVENLMYVFVTHPDSDHIGSMPDIIENFNVSEIIMPDIKIENLPTTKIYEKLLRTINNLGIETQTAINSDVYNLGDITITVLGPVSQDNEMNNMSLVLRVVYGSNSVLLTGDAEIEEENEILASGSTLKSDVLKAGHHGSKYSSGSDFLNAVMPRTVVISCGRDNSFGHPNVETLDRFIMIGAEILRSDFYGDIVVGSDGQNLTFDYNLEGSE